MSSYINGKRAEIIVFGCLSLHEFLCIFWVLCFLKIPDCLFYIDLYYGFHRICWGIFFIYSQLFYHFTTAHFLLTHQGRLSDHSHAFFLQTNNLRIPFHRSNSIYHTHSFYRFHISLHTFSHPSIGKLLSHPSYYFSIALYKFFHHNGSILRSLRSFHGSIRLDNKIHQPRYNSLNLI